MVWLTAAVWLPAVVCALRGGLGVCIGGRGGIWSGGAKHTSLHQHSLARTRRTLSSDGLDTPPQRTSQSVPSSPPVGVAPPPLPSLSSRLEQRKDTQQSQPLGSGQSRPSGSRDDTGHEAVDGRSGVVHSNTRLVYHGSNRSPPKSNRRTRKYSCDMGCSVQ